MDIICFEEHTIDADIDRAVSLMQAAEAPYLANWGEYAEEEPSELRDTRPRLLSLKTAHRLAMDLGQGRIAAMDKHGIAMQILSSTSATQQASLAQAVKLARAANDRLAEAVHAHPNRFGGFATLPWQDPDAAATELERAVKNLGLLGSLIQGRPGEHTFLDDPRYEPVLAKHNELKVPLYVHPGVPLPQVQKSYYGALKPETTARLSMIGWGWHSEAGVHVLRLILSGAFERHRDLQVISGHWGEMVPFFLQRLDDTLPLSVTGLSRTISEIYKAHVYVTPSGMLNVPHFEFVYKVLGAHRILYAIDYPYLSLTGASEFLHNLALGDEDKQKIANGNARSLLRLDFSCNLLTHMSEQPVTSCNTNLH